MARSATLRVQQCFSSTVHFFVHSVTGKSKIGSENYHTSPCLHPCLVESHKLMVSLKVRLHCLVIVPSDLPGYHENPSTSIQDAFTQFGNVPGYNASVVCSLDPVTAEEANHMLVTCALVLVVSFSRDRNHGLSRTVCQLLFRF